MSAVLDDSDHDGLSANRFTSGAAPSLGKMTTQVTNYVAATIIADPGFPKKESLPALYPPAFQNLGHQPLLDYKQLLRILWQVVGEIQARVNKWDKQRRWYWILWSVIVAEIGVVTGALAGINLPILLAAPGGWIVYQFGKSRYRRAVHKEVSEIRAQAIKRLIHGRWRVKTNPKIERILSDELKDVGDGVLGRDKIPVITIHDDAHPFQGYGRLQMDNLYICRPKEKEVGNSPSIENIRNEVVAGIKDSVLKSGISEVLFGDVIAIRGDSILIDSWWLNQDKVPVIWLSSRRAFDVEHLDKTTSVRTYFATQVLFPKYMTTATFFVRVFSAGRSAACQIAVCTLGPPRLGSQFFLARLLKHKMEKKEEKQQEKGKILRLTNGESEATNELRSLRYHNRHESSFQAPLNFSEIKKLTLSEKDNERDDDYREEYEKVIRESALWPGFSYSAFNCREGYSLTFTDDFFGRPEAQGSVRAIYDQISRAILDALDSLGYDISDYRDSEGHYSINADKIDHLVVGKEIHIASSKANEKSADGKSTKRDKVAQPDAT